MPKPSTFVLSKDREVRTAKPRGKRAEYRVKGAANLVLRVSEGGSKTWVFLYANPSSGKRSKLTFGSYPAVSLAAARDETLTLTLAVRQGVDPAAKRRAHNEAASFEDLAYAYMREHEQKFARGGKRSG